MRASVRASQVEIGVEQGRVRGELSWELVPVAARRRELLMNAGGSQTARVAAAKFALDRLTTNSPAGLEVAKRALWLEQQQRMKLEAPTARAKLERLIEARARERLEALTEAELAERVERRAAEKAKEMYEERIRLETEAVKAEMLGNP